MLEDAPEAADVAWDTERRIRDPIHKYIPISRRVCSFIDTPQFQRLKKIKQLGTSYYVWPGASNNRFEHCLGVAHLARQMAQHLKDRQPELGITARDVECVQLAGLCHDLGHGPWSHVWDGMFIPRALKGMDWKHEDASEMMFDDLVKTNNIDISAEDAKFVKALIAGDASRCADQAEKAFLFEIVANKRNGIDVDKFDYIARDCYHLVGQQPNVELERLIHSSRVIDGEVCWEYKDAMSLHNVCHTRYTLHKMYYSHKTARAIEYMIIDALMEAEPYLHIAQRIFDPKKFLYLTDSIMDRIQESTEPELEKSRQIFHRVITRDLYRLVDVNLVAYADLPVLRREVTEEAIVAAVKRAFAPGAAAVGDVLPTLAPGVSSGDVLAGGDTADPALVAALSPEHLIIDISTLHYGMKQQYPMDLIRVYRKTNNNATMRASESLFAGARPAEFAEGLLRVYTRDTRFFGLIQYGYRQVLKEKSPKVDAVAATEPPTPPASTQSAQTPRVGSLASIPPSTPPARAASLQRGVTPASGPTPGATITPNPLLTVPVSYVPASPTGPARRGAKRARSPEREHDAERTPAAKRVAT